MKCHLTYSPFTEDLQMKNYKIRKKIFINNYNEEEPQYIIIKQTHLNVDSIKCIIKKKINNNVK